MKARCYDRNRDRFKDYGGRGITVCDEWRNSYESFAKWAKENGYSDDLTIDRINNDKGYSPDNCRFTTAKMQARNTRKIHADNSSGYRGVSRQSGSVGWRARIKADSGEIYIGSFKTALEAARAYDQYVIDNNLEHTINDC